MADILDAVGHKIATIDESGVVRNLSAVNIGHVLPNGEVYNNLGAKVGSFRSDGYVYNSQASHVGTVQANGEVHDYENHLVAKIAGEHIESGGAAFLLLVR